MSIIYVFVCTVSGSKLSIAMASRQAQLLKHIENSNARMDWYNGIPGLTLNLDFLAAGGADPALLRLWENGRPLDARQNEVCGRKNPK